jgi:hypothetical protein
MIKMIGLFFIIGIVGIIVFVLWVISYIIEWILYGLGEEKE